METNFLTKVVFAFIFSTLVFISGLPFVLIGIATVWWIRFFIIQKGTEVKKSIFFSIKFLFATYFLFSFFAIFYKPIQDFVATFAMGLSR